MEKSCFKCKHYDYKQYVCDYNYACKCIKDEEETASKCEHYDEGKYEYGSNTCPNCGYDVSSLVQKSKGMVSGNKGITLKSKLKVVKINKRTKAKMFENLVVGSKILISVCTNRIGSNTRGLTRAVDIKVENLVTKEVAHKTFNEIGTILSCFDFEEIE